MAEVENRETCAMAPEVAPNNGARNIGGASNAYFVHVVVMIRAIVRECCRCVDSIYEVIQYSASRKQSRTGLLR